MIPQKVDNLLVTSKVLLPAARSSCCRECIRLNESTGAAAGTTVAFALGEHRAPLELVDHSRAEPQLEALQRRSGEKW